MCNFRDVSRVYMWKTVIFIYNVFISDIDWIWFYFSLSSFKVMMVCRRMLIRLHSSWLLFILLYSSWGQPYECKFKFPTNFNIFFFVNIVPHTLYIYILRTLRYCFYGLLWCCDLWERIKGFSECLAWILFMNSWTFHENYVEVYQIWPSFIIFFSFYTSRPKWRFLAHVFLEIYLTVYNP